MYNEEKVGCRRCGQIFRYDELPTVPNPDYMVTSGHARITAGYCPECGAKETPDEAVSTCDICGKDYIEDVGSDDYICDECIESLTKNPIRVYNLLKDGCDEYTLPFVLVEMLGGIDEVVGILEEKLEQRYKDYFGLFRGSWCAEEFSRSVNAVVKEYSSEIAEAIEYEKERKK